MGKKLSYSLLAVENEAMMGNSYGSLDEKGKKSYTEKLSCVGLSLNGDMTWPKVEYGHLIVYFHQKAATNAQEIQASCAFESAF